MACRHYLITTVLLVIFASAMALTCLMCGTYECPLLNDDCPAGEVTDVCNCCLQCGRAENETCGGDWGMLGKCGNGLECVQVPAVTESYPTFDFIYGLCRKITYH